MTSLTDADFAELTRRHRRELHVHCYRMLASFDEAEDAVQETLLRAWRGRAGFDGGPTVRAWLYKISTNVCLDLLSVSRRRAGAAASPAELPWLQPYPDRLLDEVAPAAERPEEAAVARETIELAFLAALQVLPPRQRAVLIARDVLGWPATETAESLGLSLAAANSALQRARVTMRERLPARREQWRARPADPAERETLARFIDAHQRCDATAALAIVAPSIRVTMPPNPFWFDGASAVGDLLRRAFGPGRDGDWRLLPVAANRMPAAASYLRRPGDTAYRAFKLDVLRIEAGRISEITTFGPAQFAGFGLAELLSGFDIAY